MLFGWRWVWQALEGVCVCLRHLVVLLLVLLFVLLLVAPVLMGVAVMELLLQHWMLQLWGLTQAQESQQAFLSSFLQSQQSLDQAAVSLAQAPLEVPDQALLCGCLGVRFHLHGLHLRGLHQHQQEQHLGRQSVRAPPATHHCWTRVGRARCTAWLCTQGEVRVALAVHPCLLLMMMELSQCLVSFAMNASWLVAVCAAESAACAVWYCWV
mgnify:CR=1 FL=1